MAVTEEKPVKKHANYVLVFIVLAILTAIEVTITQLPLPRAPLLIPLSIIKASLVAMFYMHLRSDRRVFTVMFGLGALVGVSLLISFVILMNTSAGGVHSH